MKHTFLILSFGLFFVDSTFAQITGATHDEREIHILIETYAESRTEKDSELLENILTSDIDQLVSSGKWRKGKAEVLEGMTQSSESNPGTRSLTIEMIRFLNSTTALVDARYDIQNPNGSKRKMWSTFILVNEDKKWKISAIRNMLPSVPNT